MSYLESNQAYWEKGYQAIWPDHPVFRFFGRIIKPDFPHHIGGKLVDFGCGQGSAVNYFHMQSFDVRGSDISNHDINVARVRFPHIADRFSICDAKPENNEHYGFAEGVSVVTAIQSLYYFNDPDFEVAIKKLYDCMKPGAVFYATMMGEQSKEFFDNSEDAGNGLRVVAFKNKRVSCDGYYMSFIRDEDHLREKFKLFTPVHTGYYAAKLRSDEGDGFHYTFCGVKD